MAVFDAQMRELRAAADDAAQPHVGDDAALACDHLRHEGANTGYSITYLAMGFANVRDGADRSAG